MKGNTKLRHTEMKINKNLKGVVTDVVVGILSLSSTSAVKQITDKPVFQEVSLCPDLPLCAQMAWFHNGRGALELKWDWGDSSNSSDGFNQMISCNRPA